MSTSTISLSRKIIIRPLDGQNQVYENIPADATVRDLKERVFVTDGVPIQNQKLIFGPEVMEDTRTLESYHIPEGFVVRLLTVVHSAAPEPAPQGQGTSMDERVLRTVFIIPATSKGTVAMNDIRLVTTVEEFKRLYCSKRGSDPEYCRLIFSGKELEDNRSGKVMTLMDYDVQNDSTLHEVYRLPGGYP